MFIPRRPAWSLAVYPARSAGRSLMLCRRPMGNAHFPATQWSLQQSALSLYSPPRTSGASVVDWLSLSCPYRPNLRVTPRLTSPCHLLCPQVLTPGVGWGMNLSLPRLVPGPPCAWSAAPPSPGPLSWYTATLAGGPLYSPAPLSTSPPSGASPKAPGCEMFAPGAPPSPISGQRWGTLRTCARYPWRSSCVCLPPKRPGASQYAVGWHGMQWHVGIVAVSPSGRWWTSPSSTVCPASPTALPRSSWQSTSQLSLSARHSASMSWPRGHVTTPAMPRSRWCRRLGGCQGWCEPSLCIPPRDKVPPGSGCTLDCPPTTLPPPPVSLLGCPLLSALCCWSSCVVLASVTCHNFFSSSLRSPVASVASGVSPPLLSPAAAYASPSPSPLWLLPP